MGYQIQLNPSRNGRDEHPGVAWVDEADAPLLGKRKWFYSNAGIYTTQDEQGEPLNKRILLHRIVAGVLDKPGRVVRFRDGNVKNCSRSNLVILTKAQLAADIVANNPNAPESLKQAVMGATPPTLEDFFKESTYPDEDGFLWDMDLLRSYEAWRKERGLLPIPRDMSMKSLRTYMAEQGYKKGMSSSRGVRWNGISECFDPEPIRERTQDATVAPEVVPSPPSVPTSVMVEINAIHDVIAALQELSKEAGKQAVERVLEYAANHYDIVLVRRVGMFS